jgi:hypothetical protein
MYASIYTLKWRGEGSSEQLEGIDETGSTLTAALVISRSLHVPQTAPT